MVNQYCAHSFARSWQLPFLNLGKGENDLRKYFTINSPWKNVTDLAGVKPATSWPPVERASNWATKAGSMHIIILTHCISKKKRILLVCASQSPIMQFYNICVSWNKKYGWKDHLVQTYEFAHTLHLKLIINPWHAIHNYRWHSVWKKKKKKSLYKIRLNISC